MLREPQRRTPTQDRSLDGLRGLCLRPPGTRETHTPGELGAKGLAFSLPLPEEARQGNALASEDSVRITGHLSSFHPFASSEPAFAAGSADQPASSQLPQSWKLHTLSTAEHQRDSAGTAPLLPAGLSPRH